LEQAQLAHDKNAPHKKRFIEVYSELGHIGKAAEACGIPRRTLYGWRTQDKTFAKAWADAEYASTAVLEDEAQRRAIEGTEKPVYQGGKLVGTVREYSDTLLIFLLKGKNPKYRDNHRVELTGKDGEAISIQTVDAVDRDLILGSMFDKRN